MITIDTITQVGFPIAVCIYLLYERQNFTVQLVREINENNIKLIKAINDLKLTIVEMKGKMKWI